MTWWPRMTEETIESFSQRDIVNRLLELERFIYELDRKVKELSERLDKLERSRGADFEPISASWYPLAGRL